MSALVLYDDARARSFEPFALTRPASEMRAGALLVRERWERIASASAGGFLGAPHLADFEEEGAPRSVDAVPEGALLVNARFAPALDGRVASGVSRLTAGGRTAAVRVARAIDRRHLAEGVTSLNDVAASDGECRELGGWWIDEVWDYIAQLSAMLSADIVALGAGMRVLGPDDAICIGSAPVFVEAGATIEPQACFDTALGPVLVRRDAVVQAFTRVVGPCYVGEGSLVTTDRVSGCSIGPQCKVHGEMSGCVILGYTNKGHAGFVGHSYLGRWVNLGAGTVTSNLKNTYGPVSMWTPQGVRDTGLQYLGSMIGDHVRTGINLPLSTGSVIGAGASIFGRMPPRVVAPFAWGETGQFETYEMDKFFEVAVRVMARRSISLGERARRQLAASFAARWSA